LRKQSSARNDFKIKIVSSKTESRHRHWFHSSQYQVS
jgi:hypothetical protein